MKRRSIVALSLAALLMFVSFTVNIDSALAAEKKGGSKSEIKAQDGRFIAYKDGTVLDTKTNLMWAAKDNGSNITWKDAKSYCENYSGGGYSDWRMPTLHELAGLYDKGKGYTPMCASSGDTNKVHLTDLITLSCWAAWSSETRGPSATRFHFYGGDKSWRFRSVSSYRRALPVRSNK